MRDKHSDLLRVGKVSSIDYEHCTAKVVFEDRHDIVSADLRIIVPLTLEDHAYYMPDIDERVVCVFDPSAPTKGYICGSYYADTRMPPIQNKDKRYFKFKDETLIEYDRDEHLLTIEIPEDSEKSIEVFAESDIDTETNGNMNTSVLEDINVDCYQNVNIEVLEDINVESAQNIDVEVAEDITIEAGQDIEIDAENITITGKTKISLIVGGTKVIITAAGISIEGDIAQNSTHSDSVGPHCSC